MVQWRYIWEMIDQRSYLRDEDQISICTKIDENIGSVYLLFKQRQWETLTFMIALTELINLYI